MLRRNNLKGNLETIIIVASSLSKPGPQKTETLAGEDRLFLSASELIVISLFKFRYSTYVSSFYTSLVIYTISLQRDTPLFD
jgi:hypothetical protein